MWSVTMAEWCLIDIENVCNGESKTVCITVFLIIRTNMPFY